MEDIIVVQTLKDYFFESQFFFLFLLPMFISVNYSTMSKLVYCELMINKDFCKHNHTRMEIFCPNKDVA